MADKLFSKLGFILETDTDETIFYTSEDVSVEFNLLNHTYQVTCFDIMEERSVYSAVTVCLHEAISAKLEELGWM